MKDYVVKQGLETMKVDTLMARAISTTSDRKFHLSLAEQYLDDLVTDLGTLDSGEIVPLVSLPSISTIYQLDSVLANTQILLDEQFHKSLSSDKNQFYSPPNCDVSTLLLPSILSLVKIFAVYVRSYVLGNVKLGDDHGACSVTPESLRAYNAVARISSSANAKLTLSGAMSALPAPVRAAFDKWNAGGGPEFPAVSDWSGTFASDNLPAESYIDAVRAAHLAATPPGPSASLRHVLQVLVTFSIDLATTWGTGDAAVAASVADVLLPLSCEVTLSGLSELLTGALEKLVGPADSDDMLGRLYSHVVGVCRDIIIDHVTHVDEHVVQECMQFLENSLDYVPARAAMEQLLAKNDDLLSILLLASSTGRSATYGTSVLTFFNKLVQLADRTPSDPSCVAMCRSLLSLSSLNTTVVQEWLSRIVVIPAGGSATDDSKASENRLLLQNLTLYIVKESSHIGMEVASAILSALIPMGSQVNFVISTHDNGGILSLLFVCLLFCLSVWDASPKLLNGLTENFAQGRQMAVCPRYYISHFDRYIVRGKSYSCLAHPAHQAG